MDPKLEELAQQTETMMNTSLITDTWLCKVFSLLVENGALIILATLVAIVLVIRAWRGRSWFLAKLLNVKNTLKLSLLIGASLGVGMSLLRTAAILSGECQAFPGESIAKLAYLSALFEGAFFAILFSGPGVLLILLLAYLKAEFKASQ